MLRVRRAALSAEFYSVPAQLLWVAGRQARGAEGVAKVTGTWPAGHTALEEGPSPPLVLAWWGSSGCSRQQPQSGVVFGGAPSGCSRQQPQSGVVLGGAPLPALKLLSTHRPAL